MAPAAAVALLAVFVIGCAQGLCVGGGAVGGALHLRARAAGADAAPRPRLGGALLGGALLALPGVPLRQCSPQLHLRGGDDGDDEEEAGGGDDEQDAAAGEEEGGDEGEDEEDADAGPMTITKAIKQVTCRAPRQALRICAQSAPLLSCARRILPVWRAASVLGPACAPRAPCASAPEARKRAA